MENAEKRPDDRGVLLHQLAMVLGYWGTDNSILWSRSSFFILTNSILIAFLAAAPSDTYVPPFILIWVVPVLGMAVNVAWWLTNMRSIAYIRHFEDIVRSIRLQLPEIQFMAPELLNNRLSHWFQRVSTKRLFEFVPGVFWVFWIIVLAG